MNQGEIVSGGAVSWGTNDRESGGPTLSPKPAYISEKVLEDAATHPAYMNMMFWTAVMVGAIGLVSLLALFFLAWFDKAIPDALGGALQWALVILGVLLVGEALLGKLTVTRND